MYGIAVSPFSKALMSSGVRTSQIWHLLHLEKADYLLGQDSACHDMAVVVIYVGNIGTYRNSKYQRLTWQAW